MVKTTRDTAASHLPGYLLSRRAMLMASGAMLAVAAASSGSHQAALAWQTPEAVPESGDTSPELAAFDSAMRALVSRWELPGAQLAVARDGRLVFDRGYGLADIEANVPVQPDHLFRIASVSKTITAVGILRLVEDGQLALSDPVFPLLSLDPPPGAVLDPRLDEITVEHLLIHAGGWNASLSGDPQYLPICQVAAPMFGEPGPPAPESIIRFMLGSPLDFDPGTASIYSNFGFNVAGRVIEHVSGQPYETFIKEQVLEPAGVTTMRLGKTSLADRADGEVRYYQPPEYPATVPSVYPGEGYVPFAYGSFYMDAMDAHGGWIASASDVLRYATAIDGQRGNALLQPETVEHMVSAPRPPSEGFNGAANQDPATGLGWVVQPGTDGMEWAHTGALGGSTAALLLRTGDGGWISFLANSLPADFVTFFDELRQTLADAESEISSWPTNDLFDPSSWTDVWAEG